MSAPKSVIDKWLHYDNHYTRRQIYSALGIRGADYYLYMEKPWLYFNIEKMEKVAHILKKDISEVFWACYKRPYKYIYDDLEKLRTNAALERAGIK